MIAIQLHGLSDTIKALQELPAEIVSKGGGPVKTAVRRGGKVILDQVERNLRQVLQHSRDADEQEATGLLLKSLRLSRAKPPLDQKGERYLVRFGRKRYPDRKGKVVTTLKTAQILEYGSEKQRPRAFIRPAYISRAEEALRVIESTLMSEIERIARKVARTRKA